MNTITNKKLTLKLNGQWQRIGYGKVAKVITDLFIGNLVKALDIQYSLKSDKSPDFTKVEYINPVDWNEWITLPIRSWDVVIHSQKLMIRVPTVVITCNFNDMPFKTWKKIPTKEEIYTRDQYIDQYTGKKLKRNELSIDHIIATSKGGKHSWNNLVTTDKRFNSFKGDKSNEEIGVKLIKQPRMPLPIPISQLIKEIRHIDHALFMEK